MNRTRILILIALALTIVLVGCDEDEETTILQSVELPPQVQAIIVANGPRRVANDPAAEAYVSVSAYPAVPQALIDQNPLAIDPEFTLYSGGIGFAGPIQEPEDGTFDLLVDFGDAAEAGTASLPALGSFAVVGEPDIEVVPGDPVQLTWTTAANAECYWVQCYFEVRYAGDPTKSISWEDRFTTFVNDTTMTLTAADMFPAEAANEDITYFYGDVDIMPVVGPIQPGDLPNIAGCEGVMVSLGQDLDWDLDLRNDESQVKTVGREQTIDPLDILRR